MPGFELLAKTITSQGLCTGCGGCVGVCPTKALAMDYTLDEPEPKQVGACNACDLCLTVCPGQDIPLPAMEQFAFGRTRNKDEYYIGVYQNIYKAYSTSNEMRAAGTSGGLGTGILSYLLSEGQIDGAIIVGMDKKKPYMSMPKIARNQAEIQEGAQSKYAIVPVMSELNHAVTELGLGKIAFIGLPCHIHALRKMQMAGKPQNLIKSISCTIGLFCQHRQRWST